jgi:small-conductance mechanosensitive channel
MTINLGSAMARFEGMWAYLLELLPGLLVGTLVFAGFRFAARAAERGAATLAERAGQDRSVAVVLGRVSGWALTVFGLMVAIIVIFPSLDAAALFGALGIGGVAIGFAFKDIFQNLLAGLLILATRPFRIGDQIVSGAHEGTVEDVQFRATLLRAHDNRLVVIPNSELYTSRVVVNTASDKRRLTVKFGVGYGEDVNTAKAIILDVARAIPDILDDPAPSVLVVGLGDSTVDLEARVWVGQANRSAAVVAVDELLQGGMEALTAAGIDLPFPTQTVLMRGQTEEGEAGRRREGQDKPAPRADLSGRSRHDIQQEQRKALAQEEAVTEREAKENKKRITANTRESEVAAR